MNCVGCEKFTGYGISQAVKNFACYENFYNLHFSPKIKQKPTKINTRIFFKKIAKKN